MREIVQFVDRIPQDRIALALEAYAPAAIEAARLGQSSPRELRRQAVVAGALVNRVLFEILGLPQDPAVPV